MRRSLSLHRPHDVMIPPSFNTILFGETGVGKSSVINLIARKKVAEASYESKGCTLESRQYAFQLAGKTFNVWDTVGLREPFFSTTHYLSAIEKAYTLIQQIEAHGGLDLLLFCIPGDSVITATIQSNYRLFFEVLCEKRVPIAIVVTHLEDEENMEEWWNRNEKSVSKWGLKFSGHACVTGLPDHQKAEEGRDSLERLLLGYNPEGRYTMPPASDRFVGFLTRLRAIPQPKDKQSQLEWLLRTRCAMGSVDARRVAQTLASHIGNPSLSTQEDQPKDASQTRSSFNVILFGEAGVGKSSVINLIAGEKVAETSRDTWGCTLESKQHAFTVEERTFNIWDTIGLGEPILSVSNCLGAIEKTYQLIQQIEAQSGLDLLLFCMPASRITDTIVCNYRLFYEVLCEERVPISVVVTRLEDEAKMEEWWARNKEFIGKNGLNFGGHACITGKPGDPKAAEGRDALKHLLLGYDRSDHGGRRPMPPASDWFSGFVERLPMIPRAKALKDKQKELEKLLCNRCMMDSPDARRLAGNLVNVHPRPRNQAH